jgi:hypothetical protein
MSLDNELSTAQRAYVRQFEKMLRTPDGIDFCVEFAARIGIKLDRDSHLRDTKRRPRGALTPAKVRQIRAMRERGATYVALAREFEVTPATARNAASRRTWVSVP